MASLARIEDAVCQLSRFVIVSDERVQRIDIIRLKFSLIEERYTVCQLIVNKGYCINLPKAKEIVIAGFSYMKLERPLMYAETPSASSCWLLPE